MRKINLFFHVEPTNTGFSIFEAHRRIITVGDTIEELKCNALEAAQYYFEDEKVSINSSDLSFQWYPGGESIK